MEKFGYLKSSNVEYIDALYEKYLENPDSVEETWRYFFEGMELGGESAAASAPQNNITNAASNTQSQRSDQSPSLSLVSSAPAGLQPSVLTAEGKIVDLIQAYRQRGHLNATVNPGFGIVSHTPPIPCTLPCSV